MEKKNAIRIAVTTAALIVAVAIAMFVALKASSAKQSLAVDFSNLAFELGNGEPSVFLGTIFDEEL
jgi:ABC-type dipeptide/oligopeptide/nickel transport system permease component